MAYACDQHPDVSAAVLMTNLDNGDVIALCGTVCLPDWVHAMDAVFSAHPDAPVDVEPVPPPATAADIVDGSDTSGATVDGRVDNGNGEPIEPGGTGPTMAEAGTTF